MARIRAEWKENHASCSHTLDIFVKVTDVCDEKCSDSNEITRKDDLFVFFFWLCCSLFPFVTSMQLLIQGVTCVCESWTGSFKELLKCPEATPETPYRGMWVEVSTVCWTSSSGEAYGQLWTLPVWSLFRTAPRVYNPFSIYSLHTPGETSLRVL